MDRSISLTDGQTDITDVPGRTVIAQAGHVHVSDDGSVNREYRGVCLPINWADVETATQAILISCMKNEVRERFLSRLAAA